jgi:hypothetical protein
MVLNMPMVLISIMNLSFLNLRVAELGASPAKGWLSSTTLASYSITPSSITLSFLPPQEEKLKTD